MMDYKKIEVTDKGILMNKDYYNYLKKFKVPEIIQEKFDKKEITKNEYKFLIHNNERMIMENISEDTKLVKWDNILFWKASRGLKDFKVKLNIKTLKQEFIPELNGNYALINELEKNCYNKGVLSEKPGILTSKIYTYLVYIIILVLALLMLAEMFK